MRLGSAVTPKNDRGCSQNTVSQESAFFFPTFTSRQCYWLEFRWIWQGLVGISFVRLTSICVQDCSVAQLCPHNVSKGIFLSSPKATLMNRKVSSLYRKIKRYHDLLGCEWLSLLLVTDSSYWGTKETGCVMIRKSILFKVAWDHNSPAQLALQGKTIKAVLLPALHLTYCYNSYKE